MAHIRLLKFLTSPEFGLLSTLVFAGLYTWPFLAFDRPSATFRFIFAAWGAHIMVIAASSFSSKRLALLEQGNDRESSAATGE
jgi:hypothetical protein